MITDKEKILKAMLYDENENMLVTAKNIYFPKEFFKGRRHKDLVVIRGNLPVLQTEESYTVVFEYKNSSRIKHTASVEQSDQTQMKLRADDGEVVEDRRQFYKINVSFEGTVDFYIRNGEAVYFDKPFTVFFEDLNLGGAFITSPVEFEQDDQLKIKFLGGLDVVAQVLRIIRLDDGTPKGYGLRFADMNAAKEGQLNKFIIEQQALERRKKSGGV